MSEGAERAWLTILGIGDDGMNSLTPPALALMKSARTLVAPQRVLDSLDPSSLGLENSEIVPWTMGVGPTLEFLAARRGTPVTILATGDPMHFGIGATMRRTIDADEMLVIPSPSGFSLAAARMGWSLSDVACISLHGRAAAGLQPHILPANRILSLTSVGRTIHEAAQLLVSRGYGGSRLTVLEHMGGKAERTVALTADEAGAFDADNPRFADFNVLAIECVAGEGVSILPCVPGLPDDAFVHDGQLTKREVRAITLSALQPCPHGVLWDVGAGCGSVSIEWMRAALGAKAVAIEAESERRAMIGENATRLGTPRLNIVWGRAPDELADLDAPDAVFIGGGLAEQGVFEACWQALKPGGRLVANTVTLENEARLAQLHAEYGGSLTRVAVSRAKDIGRYRGWKPFMPVTQWAVQKAWGEP
ncbi:precorrin-6y C5,15-methyltransferase (decarboxylating) subunit CbiE [Hoeflea poritis]|uniref:Precorrin-6y C5,15-methyltransferase (Decarboxylating) subunit CbiE n=1 Tax=Hoeflea poritis TaxID=2993659 RepID=A0ABT4VIX2_9HYPH|nr:precorrin-6y C5,15-methyltransferase (decarboxylating) subunit CbiE [Hoeflea poritis]MDA4844667.1 precorrin-6y C5,15-methyltransferase (decarboxylating) subunit CbiE [Hoeflea poritis]